MEPLKEMFNYAFYERFAAAFQKVYDSFNERQFLKQVTTGLEALSLNQRLRNTAVVVRQFLPADYKKAIHIMREVIPDLPHGYTTLVFPDFVGLYGKQHFEVSIDALKYFTQFGSSEFAIREFLRMDLHRTMAVMNEWAEDENHHVRRLASEGCRPRLPWSFKLEEIVRKPAITRPVLEKLKADSHIYVRKSVANHLNDISKDHPSYVLDLVAGWNKKNAHTLWIIRHGCRTLIKKGNKNSMAVFDFEKNARVKIGNFKFDRETVKLNETLEFQFSIASLKAREQKLCVDYRIHYCKKSGDTVPKVFKLREIVLQPEETVKITKRQVFRDFTTRKHYSGIHCLEIIINGDVMIKRKFKLSV